MCCISINLGGYLHLGITANSDVRNLRPQVGAIGANGYVILDRVPGASIIIIYCDIAG